MSLVSDIKKLEGFGGPVWEPADPGYATSRHIWNMRTDQDIPTCIVQPQSSDDIAAVMRYCHETATPVALRSGGHYIDGTAMPDSALVLDLTAFKSLSYDGRTGRGRVGTGVLLGEMDSAMEKHQRLIPAGTVSHTGVAGLCIGGGIGFNSRKFGATVDSLVGCELVTVDGRKLRASASENEELFWALRGGGGNFGVVTEFEFATKPISSVVSSVVICFPLDDASKLILAVRDFMTTAPRELTVVGALTQCPPFPPVPEKYHATNILIVMAIYTGLPRTSEGLFEDLVGIGNPLAVIPIKERWSHINSILDATAPYGRRYFMRGGYLTDLTKELIDAAVKNSTMAPSPTASPLPATAQNFISLGGALTDDFAEDSVAFSREGANWLWESVAQWDKPEDDQSFEEWIKAAHRDMAPHLRSNGYINLTMDQGPQWLKQIWGSAEKYDRLVEAKTRWDPQNLLRFNKNISPKGAT